MGMPQRTEPEIKRVSLTFALLHLLAAGQEDVTKFEYMDRPERDSRKLLLLSKRFPSLKYKYIWADRWEGVVSQSCSLC